MHSEIQLAPDKFSWNFSKYNVYYICSVISSFTLQGPVRFGEDGTIIYTKIRLAQIRADENSE